MDDKFDNATLREEITDYLYENAVPTHDTIESMTDDIIDILDKRMNEFKRRPIYPEKTIISPETHINQN